MTRRSIGPFGMMTFDDERGTVGMPFPAAPRSCVIYDKTTGERLLAGGFHDSVRIYEFGLVPERGEPHRFPDTGELVETMDRIARATSRKLGVIHE